MGQLEQTRVWGKKNEGKKITLSYHIAFVAQKWWITRDAFAQDNVWLLRSSGCLLGSIPSTSCLVERHHGEILFFPNRRYPSFPIIHENPSFVFVRHLASHNMIPVHVLFIYSPWHHIKISTNPLKRSCSTLTQRIKLKQNIKNWSDGHREISLNAKGTLASKLSLKWLNGDRADKQALTPSSYGLLVSSYTPD